MEKTEIQKIKEDLMKIISENSGSCLCGHSEWCEVCSPSSNHNSLRNKLREYLKQIK